MKEMKANKRFAYTKMVFVMAIFTAMVLLVALAMKNLIDDSSITVSASSDRIKILEEQLKEADAEKKRFEEEKAAIDRDRNKLEQHRSDLEVTLSQLNADMTAILAEIAQLELDIEYKLQDIEQAELDLAEAIRIKDQQYADMKRRIKHAYEQPDFLLLEALLSASSIAEFLNYADYFELLAGYDQMKLNAYRETEKTVDNYRIKLNQDKEQLDISLAQVEEKQAQISDLIEETRKKSRHASSQISEAEQELLAKEAEIKRKNEEQEQLKKDLENERRLQELARQMVWRNLSDVTFADGDRYLLASIIYCEAGGEPYQGKLAVGAVVINRMLSPVFPDTITQVIYQSRQFSPVASGRLALALAEGKATASCYQAADEAMAGMSPVGNVLFFRTPIEGVTGQYIGGHVFY